MREECLICKAPLEYLAAQNSQCTGARRLFSAAGRKGD